MKKDPKTILFLLNDTDPVLLRVIKNKFKKDAGWESTICTNYDKAVLAFEKEGPDAVMTEIILNDKKARTGFDFIAEIKDKKDGSKVQIIIFTELSQEEDIGKSTKLGVKHYFVKSKISINDLIEEINRIIR